MPIHPIRKAWLIVTLALALTGAEIAPAAASLQRRPQAVLAAPIDAGKISVVIELDQPPAADLYARIVQQTVSAAQIGAVTQAYVASLEQSQLALMAQLARFDVDILYRTQRVYNGVAARVDPARLAEIGELAGVKAVHGLISKAPTNSTSVPYIGAPILWSAPHGLTGKGITIAVIDTGLDYLHTDFGGPGAGYAQNDVTVIGDVSGFPSAKVIGGYDFTGDDYNSNPEEFSFQPNPEPDPDPADCYGSGHGTHVSGTAAGYGVLQNGSTYSGPYNTAIYSTAFRIGPGVAPEASIYALKVFGCSGHSEIVDQAIEWAVDPNQDGDFSDHVDVINMSLGSTYGSLYDPTTIAAENAARIGAIVVASAGNARDTYYTLGSPSVGDHVISVASSTEVPVAPPVAAGAAAPRDTLSSFSSRGPRRIDSALKPDLAAPGEGITSARRGSGSSAYLSSGTSMSAPHIAGSLALLRQLHPRLNAIGDLSSADLGLAWSVEDLKALAMNTAMRHIYSAVSNTSPVYGPPRIGAGRVDLGAAVDNQVIAYNGDDAGQVSLSFGAPEVLVSLEATKNLRIANKGALTATYVVSYAGVADVPGVEFTLPASNTISVPPHGFANLPVGMTAVAAAMKHTHDQTVSEFQTSPRHWLSEEFGYLVLTPVTTTSAAETNQAGPALVQNDGSTLHVPVYAAPQPASQMAVVNEVLDFGMAVEATQTITLAGSDLRGSAFPTDVVSMASFFELHLSSPNTREQASTSDGIDLYDHADLKYVGVASDYSPASGSAAPATGVADATLLFAIATHGAWSSPNEVEFDIYIDTDEDGESDYKLFNSNKEGFSATSVLESDAFVTVLEDLDTGVRTSQEFLNFYSPHARAMDLFNTNVMVLPIEASVLHLDDANSDFAYFVESYSNDISYSTFLKLYTERTPAFSFDVGRPGLAAAGTPAGVPIFEDLDGATVEINYDLPAYRAANASGLLVFHHQNVAGHRTEVVPLIGEWPIRMYLPIVAK